MPSKKQATEVKKNAFQLGESVFGLWPGSGGLYFKATVVEFDSDNKTYNVKFEEGTTYTLLEKHVKKVDSMATVETRKTPRVTRRQRSTSRSRSRSRSRTPGRRTVLKEKREPSTEKKVEPTETKEIEAEADKVKETKDAEDTEGKVDTEKKPEVSSSEPEKVVEKAIELVEDVPLSKRRATGLIPTRRSTRIAMKVESTKLDTSMESVKEESKPKETKEVECDSTEDKVDSPEVVPKYQTLITTVNIFLLCCTPVFLHLLCMYNKCTFIGLKPFSYDQIAVLLNPVVSLAVLGYFAVIALVTLISDSEKLQRCNSFIASHLLVVCGLGLMNHFKLSATTCMSFLPQCVLPTIALGLLLAVLVAFQAKESRAENAGLVSHLTVGSATNASIGGLNVKMFLNRMVFQTVVAVNVLAVLAHFEKTGQVAPTLLLSCSMQVVFSLENLLNEKSTFVESYEFTGAKLGWLLIATYLSYPLLMVVSALHIASVGEELPYYCLVPVSVLFLEGFWIKVASTKQKNAFLSNPEDPAFTNMETLSSPSGEKLLISGWWGWLRHPNYLGEIIIHLAFIMTSGLSAMMPCIFLVFAAILYMRTNGSEEASRMKYGPSWDRYCQRVPSRLLPHIY